MSKPVRLEAAECENPRNFGASKLRRPKSIDECHPFDQLSSLEARTFFSILDGTSSAKSDHNLEVLAERVVSEFSRILGPTFFFATLVGLIAGLS